MKIGRRTNVPVGTQFWGYSEDDLYEVIRKFNGNYYVCRIWKPIYDEDDNIIDYKPSEETSFLTLGDISRCEFQTSQRDYEKMLEDMDLIDELNDLAEVLRDFDELSEMYISDYFAYVEKLDDNIVKLETENFFTTVDFNFIIDDCVIMKVLSVKCKKRDIDIGELFEKYNEYCPVELAY